MKVKQMPATPNPLTEMAHLKGKVSSRDERPNSSFVKSVLPGFKKALNSRRAIRIFDGAPLPEEVMKDCLRDAMSAPSASNLQSYELYWIRDTQKKKAMAGCCLDQPAVTTAGDIIVVVSRVDLWKSHLKKLVEIMTHNSKRALEGPIHDYYHNVVPMLMRNDAFGFNNLLRRFMFWYKGLTGPTVSEPVRHGDHRVYGNVQAAIAAQTLMLSLAAHGFESCPVGGIDKVAIRKLLKLPSTAEVCLVIAAGTGKPEGLFSQRVRLPYEDLVKEV